MKYSMLLLTAVLLGTGVPPVSGQIPPGGFGANLQIGSDISGEDWAPGFAVKADGLWYVGRVVAKVGYTLDTHTDRFDDSFLLSGINGGIIYPFDPRSSTVPFISGEIGYYQALYRQYRVTSDWKPGFELGAGVRYDPQRWSHMFVILDGSFRSVSFEEPMTSLGLIAGLGYDF